jgi:NADP-dependent 3-hydroxy acid dehydrogenase YdfG
MELKGKTVLITGATSGIGEACAEAFASRGCNLILAARRGDLLSKKTEGLEKKHKIRADAYVLDVRDRKAVFAFGEEIEKKGRIPDVLVNNAGLALGFSKIYEGNIDEWDRMIDTNVKGLLYVTRAILPLMVARNYGHVVNLGSLAGRQVYPCGNVYNATKFAVDALNQGMSVDLAGTRIRVTNIEPGMVKTDFSAVRFGGDIERAEKVYEGVESLSSRDIAEAILFAVEAPDHVNIGSLLITPTAQRNVYVLHREQN